MKKINSTPVYNNSNQDSFTSETLGTGSGNTRLECLSETTERRVETLIHGIDYTFSYVKQSRFDMIADYVHRVFNDIYLNFPDKVYVRGKRYEGQTNSAHGIVIAYNPPGLDGTPGQARISIPGKALERINFEAQWWFCRAMQTDYNCKPTRTDIAVDLFGFEDENLLDKIHEAGEQGNYSGVEIWEPIKQKAYVNGGYSVTGITEYFGSKESDMRLRWYDKNLESNGKRNCIRCEVQFRREKACEFIKNFSGFPTFEQASEYATAVSLGAVRFIDRNSGDRLSRQDELDWYQKLQEEITRAVKVSVPKVETTLERSIQWIKSQVAPTLAVIRACFGFDKFYPWLDELLNETLKRLSPKQMLQIQFELSQT